MNQPTVLLWNIPVFSAAYTALNAHPVTQKFSFSHILPNQTGETLSALAGLTATVDAQPLDCSDTPAIIFCGLAESDLDTALLVLRQCGQYIPLKAILTPHNQKWQFGKLLQELDAEYKHFQKEGKFR